MITWTATASLARDLPPTAASTDSVRHFSATGAAAAALAREWWPTAASTDSVRPFFLIVAAAAALARDLWSTDLFLTFFWTVAAAFVSCAWWSTAASNELFCLNPISNKHSQKAHDFVYCLQFHCFGGHRVFSKNFWGSVVIYNNRKNSNQNF